MQRRQHADPSGCHHPETTHKQTSCSHRPDSSALWIGDTGLAVVIFVNTNSVIHQRRLGDLDFNAGISSSLSAPWDKTSKMRSSPRCASICQATGKEADPPFGE